MTHPDRIALNAQEMERKFKLTTLIRLDEVADKITAEVKEMQETAHLLQNIADASKQYAESGNYKGMLGTLTSVRLLTRAMDIHVTKINSLISAQAWAQMADEMRERRKKLTVKTPEVKP